MNLRHLGSRLLLRLRFRLHGHGRVEQTRGAGSHALGLRLLGLLPAHLLDGIDERSLVGGTNPERPNGLTVCRIGVHAALRPLAAHLVGKFMGLEPQQGQTIIQLPSIHDERGQLLRFKGTCP